MRCKRSKITCFRFYKHQSATSRSEKWGENRKLLGRTCLLCSFFHLLQFPKNDAPLKVQVTPGHTSKNGPKTATSLHYSMPRNDALRYWLIKGGMLQNICQNVNTFQFIKIQSDFGFRHSCALQESCWYLGTFAALLCRIFRDTMLCVQQV